MRPWSSTYAGRLEEVEITSRALESNALGDSPRRPLYVYLPPGYDDDTQRRYPSVYVLQGFFGAVPSWKTRTNNLRATYPEMADELFSSGAAPPLIVVFVDAWTSLGGSQFVDSPGTGRYHSYLCEDVVSFIDANYRSLDDPSHRGVQGKSSGGFGAMITPMLRPDLFGGFATHAGDALYEYCHLPALVRDLQNATGPLRLELRGLLRRHGDPPGTLAPLGRRGDDGVGDGGLLFHRRGRDGASSDRPSHGQDRRGRLARAGSTGTR